FRRVLFRSCVVGENFEFGDSVERRPEHKASIDPIEVIGAIDQKIVGLRPLPVHRIGLPGAQRTSGFGQTGRQRYNPWLQESQLGKISAIQRKFENVTLSDGLAQTADRSL